MILEQYQNAEKKKEVISEWTIFKYKNGHKDVDVKDFLTRNYTHLSYVVADKYYKGYFTRSEVDFIFEVLNYLPGKIRAMAG
jgi:hypothetical protein